MEDVPMVKQNDDIRVIAIYDGELDATEVFVRLIAQRYGHTAKINAAEPKEAIAMAADAGYNEDEVQQSQLPSGLCG